ncbi:MAG: sulfatase [Planctomycetota bacterium]|nr:MAG: sulfatase [Planctomycetota bacterium]
MMVLSVVHIPIVVLGDSDTPAVERPNFVIIFTDDQGYQDVGCYGSPLIKTPRMDKMAAEGMRFTSFYVAASVCTPSRAALLTGCYAQRVGLPTILFHNSRAGLNNNETTLAELLKIRGYATACIGKWHLGHKVDHLPGKHGFDYYFGLPYSNDMHPPSKKRDYPPLPLIRNQYAIEYDPDQTQLTRRYTEEAVKFITENKDRPFLLYLPHTMPHVPLFASQKFKGKSKRGLYGDVIEELDWSVGEILDTLARLGLDEKTLVVFTSDNGPWLEKGDDGGSALPLRDGKFSVFEGGFRVPCLMRWPGRIPAGKLCSEMVTSMDLYPTFARLAGTSPPTDRIIDGKNIWPLMTGDQEAKTPHQAFYYYRRRELRAVRSGKWKLVLEHKGRVKKGKKPTYPQALYDLEKDIGEQHDLSAKHPEVVKRLKALLQQCRQDLGDKRTDVKGQNIRPAG